MPKNFVTNKLIETKRKAIDTDRMNKVIKNSKKIVSEGKLLEDLSDIWDVLPGEDVSGNTELIFDAEGYIATDISQATQAVGRAAELQPVASVPQTSQEEVVTKISKLGGSFKDGFSTGIQNWFNSITDFFNKPIFGIAIKSWLIWGAIILIFIYVCYIIAKYLMKRIKKIKQQQIRGVNESNMNYSETDFLSKSKDFAKTSYEKGKNMAKNIYDKSKNTAVDVYDKSVDFTSNAYNKGKELASNAAPKFEEALKSGCKYVLSNKGKFIGGGALLGVITKIYSDRSLITGAYQKISQLSPEFRATAMDDMFYGLSSVVTNTKGFWGKCKAIYQGLLKGAGASAAAPTEAAGMGLSGIKSFFSQVFTDKGIAWKGTSGGHLLLYGIAALVLALIIWAAYKIIKKIIARRKAKATAESYIEAENVAYYLRENTDMSKKDCNKIANFVYRKSLDRRLLNF